MQRELGHSGIKVSAMGAGLWAVGGPWTMDGSVAGWGEVDDDESIRTIHAALDHGVNFFDTAANYGAGHSERVLARALEGRRDQAVVATKFGYVVDESNHRVESYDGGMTSQEIVNHLREDCEASLRRLKTDYIDLYQFLVNEYNPEVAAPVRDRLEKLVAEGKIRYYGWSTDFPAGARVFAQGEHCASIQANMNVTSDAPEILAVCDEFNLATIIRGPLGMGLLTGKYTRDAKWADNDVRNRDWFQKGFISPIFDNLDQIRGILTSGGRTLAQGALAWLWGRSEHTIPIPGVRTVAQIEENAGAMAFGPLTPEQMQQIETLVVRPEIA
jgi:aryl-alcohol dehydrogenase-like predicted oxidoreductase